MPFNFSGFGGLRDEFEDFQQDLEEVKQGIPEAMDEGTEKTAERIADEMRFDAPVDTGELEASIGYNQIKNAKYSVGPTAEHAPYVEYGTAPHEIRTRRSNPMHFQVDGNWVSTHYVQHPGTKAQPFFHPAVIHADEADWLDKELKKRVDALFKRAFK